MRRIIRAARRNASGGLDYAAQITESVSSQSIAGPAGRSVGRLLSAPNRIAARVIGGKKRGK